MLKTHDIFQHQLRGHMKETSVCHVHLCTCIRVLQGQGGCTKQCSFHLKKKTSPMQVWDVVEPFIDKYEVECVHTNITSPSPPLAPPPKHLEYKIEAPKI